MGVFWLITALPVQRNVSIGSGSSCLSPLSSTNFLKYFGTMKQCK